MTNGRIAILITAIGQRWQHVIARGKKMVGNHDDLSVRNESVRCCNYCNESARCCNYCNEIKFTARGEKFIFSVMCCQDEQDVLTLRKLPKI
jgi:hypothetical protein